MIEYAPIALFVYNRPEHTKKTLESLSKNELAKGSTLLVFSDGPKENADDNELKKIEEVRRIIYQSKWCGEVKLFNCDSNHGLANSLQSGITEVLNQFSKVIVLEDDLVVSPYFLDYMNDGLNRFHDMERVMQISGYMFNVPVESRFDAFFLPFVTSWGWATWNRAWEKFDNNLSRFKELSQNKALRSKFNLDDSYNYYDMLVNQVNRKIDSWAIIWYLSVFFNDGLTLYPIESLVRNCGFDGSGTHYKGNKYSERNNKLSDRSSWLLPPTIVVNENAFAAIKEYFSTSRKKKTTRSIKNKIGKYFQF